MLGSSSKTTTCGFQPENSEAPRTPEPGADGTDATSVRWRAAN